MNRFSEMEYPQDARTASAGQQGVDLTGRCTRMLRRWRTRHALLGLTPAELRDVGLSEEQAHAEARKPFWKG
ncbi:DUF1127 domain-containing protein [Pseudomonas sp.]|uniref:DUF1127 domain-containing protein n=1 Tax=Pseudomonas sp. TaxID=306 RepID=UPI0028B1718D|nr:DUF1127 domain-containing protein [Pseudomonas sp.]